MSDRRTGKIARLPHSVRTLVNEMIRDGRPYRDIIAWLKKDHGVEVEDKNLSNWRIGGHEDWLKEQERLQKYRLRAEVSIDIAKLAAETGTSLHEANLMVGASQINELLEEVDLEKLKEKCKDDPEAYVQLLTVSARMAKPALEAKKYRDVVEAARAKVQQLRDSSKKLNEKERNTIIEEVDRILGLKK